MPTKTKKRRKRRPNVFKRLRKNKAKVLASTGKGYPYIRAKPSTQKLQAVTTDSRGRVVPKRFRRRRRVKHSEYYKDTKANRLLNRVGLRK